MKVDAAFFKPIVEATRKTLSIQCSIETTPGKPFLKSTEPGMEIDIAGVIGLTSESYSGTITLCMGKTVFLSIMSRMLGEEYTEPNDELSDGIAELLNIIFGDSKAVLNAQGHSIEMAIPMVLMGEKLSTHPAQADDALVLPFDIDAGRIYIEISLDRNDK